MKHFGVQAFVAILGFARSGNAQQNIMQLLRSVSDADYMVAAIEMAQLDDDFEGSGQFSGPFTLLSTGIDGWTAFEDAEDRILAYKDTGTSSDDDRFYFTALILGQTLSGVTFTSDMSNEEVFTTSNSKTFTYFDNPTPLFNNAVGTDVDNEVSNGVVHFVNAVVQGGTPPNSPTPPTPTPPTPTPPTPTPPTPTPPTPTPPTPTPPTPTPPTPTPPTPTPPTPTPPTPTPPTPSPPSNPNPPLAPTAQQLCEAIAVLNTIGKSLSKRFLPFVEG